MKVHTGFELHLGANEEGIYHACPSSIDFKTPFDTVVYLALECIYIPR